MRPRYGVLLDDIPAPRLPKVAGATAAKVGSPWSIMGGGALCLGGTAWFAWLLPRLRVWCAHLSGTGHLAAGAALAGAVIAPSKIATDIRR